MIYCSCDYTAKQLALWIEKAQAAKTLERAAMRSLCVSVRNNNLAHQRKDEIAQVWADAKSGAEWADRFLRLIDGWQYPTTDRGLICFLYAEKGSECEGAVSEFNFVLYEREKDSGPLGYFDPRIDGGLIQLDEAIQRDKVMFNGGLINHGTNDAPNWASHT